MDILKNPKVLVVNWTWYPSGGDWTYVENLKRIYEGKGFEVVPFSMHDERNFETPYSKYFVSKIDYKDLNQKKSLGNAFKAARNAIYSSEAKRNLRKLLDENDISIVHLNNIHHYISPASIIPVIHKRKIPIVWTLHDYTILCPNTTFISKGEVCERCKVGKFYHCATRKCKKNSRSASILAATESYVNKWLNPYKHVQYFLCPSQFIANKFIEYGFKEKKIIQLYNPFDISSLNNLQPDNAAVRPYIVYVGNILRVKGVFTLAEAVKGLGVELKMIGDGESFDELKSFVQKNSIENISFTGRKTKQEVLQIVKNAVFVVVPSEWYENLPYSLVEALLLSKPVVGARIGGIPELVIEHQTGCLFEPGNPVDMRKKMEYMLSLNRETLERMGATARNHAEKMVNYQAFGRQLEDVLNRLEIRN